MFRRTVRLFVLILLAAGIAGCFDTTESEFSTLVVRAQNEVRAAENEMQQYGRASRPYRLLNDKVAMVKFRMMLPRDSRENLDSLRQAVNDLASARQRVVSMQQSALDQVRREVRALQQGQSSSEHPPRVRTFEGVMEDSGAPR